MRFYLDEDLSDQIEAIARERFSLDVWSSHEQGMDGATDEEPAVRQMFTSIRQLDVLTSECARCPGGAMTCF